MAEIKTVLMQRERKQKQFKDHLNKGFKTVAWVYIMSLGFYVTLSYQYCKTPGAYLHDQHHQRGLKRLG